MRRSQRRSQDTQEHLGLHDARHPSDTSNHQPAERQHMNCRSAEGRRVVVECPKQLGKVCRDLRSSVRRKAEEPGVYLFSHARTCLTQWCGAESPFVSVSFPCIKISKIFNRSTGTTCSIQYIVFVILLCKIWHSHCMFNTEATTKKTTKKIQNKTPWIESHTHPCLHACQSTPEPWLLCAFGYTPP